MFNFFILRVESLKICCNSELCWKEWKLMDYQNNTSKLFYSIAVSWLYISSYFCLGWVNNISMLTNDLYLTISTLNDNSI